MASIISELRSVTFQSVRSRTVFVSEINIKDNKMAPQQHDAVIKNSDIEAEQSQKSSPVSNLGTSVESSSPPLILEDAPENTNEPKVETKIEEPSSDDSGSVHSYEVKSPLMCLQSSLKKNGRLGKKLYASSSLPKIKFENNWQPSTSSPVFERNLTMESNEFYERNLPVPASGFYDKNFPSSTDVHRNNVSPTTTGIFYSNLQSTTNRIYDNSLQPSSSRNYEINLPSTSSGIYHPNLPTPNGMYYGTPSISKGIPHNTLSSTSTSIYDANTFSCRVCDFTCISKEDYDTHMNMHYNHKCPHCNYTSRTEGRLKRHVKEFHSATPPDSWAGTRSSKKEMNNSDLSIDSSVTSSNGKARTFKCKHCEFVAFQKSEFWKHSKEHIKPDKLLQCPHCEFVTEFKHHYEYHISNHFGRKPFKCSMCNYKCVNKSMLNSHLKSHSSIYQFHCADCKYETKYCHSIKQHLKKQNHKQGLVLNQDGTPCPHIVIDVYGKRRGPRMKKKSGKESQTSISNGNTSSMVPAASQLSSVLGSNFQSAMLQPNIPTMYPSLFDYQQNLIMRTSPQMNNSSFSMPVTVPRRNSNNCFRCAMCTFVTDDENVQKRHIMLHIASDNADIAKLCGINPEFFREQEMGLNSDMSHQNNCNDEGEKRLFSPRNDSSESNGCNQGYDENLLESRNEKSEEDRSPKYQEISTPHNDDENESFKEYSSPSPPGSSSHSPDLIPYTAKTLENSTDRNSPNFAEEENRMEDNESPIDLSGRKSSDSSKMEKNSEGTVENFQSKEQRLLTLASNIKSMKVSSTSQRNRRKGKAYRINHYMQYDEQSIHQESKPSSNLNSSDSNEKTSMEDTKNMPVAESQMPLRILREFPENQMNIYVPPPRTENNSDSQSESRKQRCIESRVDSPNAGNGHYPTSSSDKVDDSARDDCSLNEEPMELESTADSQKVKGNETKWHNTGYAYECIPCGIIFNCSAMYLVHKGTHGFKESFTCNYCGQKRKSALDLFTHTLKDPHR